MDGFVPKSIFFYNPFWPPSLPASPKRAWQTSSYTDRRKRNCHALLVIAMDSCLLQKCTAPCQTVHATILTSHPASNVHPPAAQIQQQWKWACQRAMAGNWCANWSTDLMWFGHVSHACGHCYLLLTLFRIITPRVTMQASKRAQLYMVAGDICATQIKQVWRFGAHDDP